MHTVYAFAHLSEGLKNVDICSLGKFALAAQSGYLSLYWQWNMSCQMFLGWHPLCRQAHRSTWDHSHPPFSPCQWAWRGKKTVIEMQHEWCRTKSKEVIACTAFTWWSKENGSCLLLLWPRLKNIYLSISIDEWISKNMLKMNGGAESPHTWWQKGLYLPSISTTFKVSSSSRHFIS